MFLFITARNLAVQAQSTVWQAIFKAIGTAHHRVLEESQSIARVQCMMIMHLGPGPLTLPRLGDPLSRTPVALQASPCLALHWGPLWWTPPAPGPQEHKGKVESAMDPSPGHAPFLALAKEIALATATSSDSPTS